MSSNPGPTGSSPLGRRVARGLLVLSIAVGMVVAARPAGRQSKDLRRDPRDALFEFTLKQGSIYGAAQLQFGGDTVQFGGDTEVPLEQIEEHCQRALAGVPLTSGSPSVVVRASGGVRQRELERIRAAVSRACGDRTPTVWLELDSALDFDPDSMPTAMANQSPVEDQP